LSGIILLTVGFGALFHAWTPDHQVAALVVPEVDPPWPAEEGTVELPDLVPVGVSVHPPDVPAEPVPPELGALSVEIADDAHFTHLIVSCDGQPAQRVGFVGRRADVEGLPVLGECAVSFRGGHAVTPLKAHGGQAWSCSFGTVARCVLTD
jgi:hypothetical protein